MSEPSRDRRTICEVISHSSDFFHQVPSKYECAKAVYIGIGTEWKRRGIHSIQRRYDFVVIGLGVIEHMRCIVIQLFLGRLERDDQANHQPCESAEQD